MDGWETSIQAVKRGNSDEDSTGQIRTQKRFQENIGRTYHPMVNGIEKQGEAAHTGTLMKIDFHNSNAVGDCLHSQGNTPNIFELTKHILSEDQGY